MRVVASSPFAPFIGRARSFGVLSSFPPTACGLATFSAALASGLAAHNSDVAIVRVVDAADSGGAADESVVGDLVNNSPTSVAATSDVLNRYDVAVIQHEYGLYGGTDGDEVLEILAGLRVPSIVVAHTVLCDPTPHQRAVLNEVTALASSVVVMSEAARRRLCSVFEVDPSKIVTIQHGAVVPGHAMAASRRGRPVMLTWGLIGPGKGIERVIAAMPALHDLPTRPRYLVAGQTHPKVLARHGESYRRARIDQATRLGVAESVAFDADYRDVASLTALIQSSAVVVLPYDSTEQATSGVLVDAIAAGRPVVATAFPHAKELLASGAGLVVPHDDPDAMAFALHRVLTEPDLAERMAAEARRLAPTLGWPVVAGQYLQVADDLVAAQLALV